MNAFDRAKRAYTSPATPTRTLRGTEYDAFARITHRLKTAGTDSRQNYAALATALQDNRDLWSVLSADVSDNRNGLPLLLRQQIFGLAGFIQKHTSRVLAGNATTDALIAINTAIMRGLRREGAEQ